MSIFARLGYDEANTSSIVTPLSANVISTMNNLPPLLNTWQTADAANNDVGGYFQNPVANVTQSIWSVANTIIAIPNLNQVANLANIASSANALYQAANNFYSHTNRISGVSPDSDEPTLPHFKSAMAVSKVVMYITFQSDGVQNNAPMMGNFTSLIQANNLTISYNTISTYSGNIANSISSSSDGGEPPVTTYSSNLTSNQITTIVNNLNIATNLMNSRRNGDVNFYYNSQGIVNDYNTLKQFSTPGQSESYLYNDYVGTEKLKTRINS
jgi:hypothetical protein